MSSRAILFLTAIFVISMSVSVAAFSKRYMSVWNYYYFNGNSFIAGKPGDGTTFLAVQDQMLPVVLSSWSDKVEPVALPADKGAIAGICYLQSSGGKLSSGPGYAPCPRTSITITSGKTVAAVVISDKHGYFVASLPAGNYRVGTGMFAAEVLVMKGTTALVPLRAGKRMVD
jgi:hypothetical protein